MRRARRALALAAWAALSVAVPLAARGYLEWRLSTGVEPALSGIFGRPVSVGGVEAILTGAVRFDRVSVDGLVDADWVEAGLGPGDLLAGRAVPTEVRIARPRLHLDLDRRGEDDLRRLVRRLGARRSRDHRSAQGSGSLGHLRRVVVTGGDLEIRLAGAGLVRASAVELRPLPGGARITSGPLEGEVAAGPMRLSGRFGRAAADLDLASFRVARFLAVGGALELGGRLPGSIRTELVAATISGGAATGDARLIGRFAGPGKADLDLRVAPAAGGARAELQLTGAPLAALGPLVPDWVDTADARVTGRAAVDLAAGGAVDFDLDAAVDGLVLEHGRLASNPVPLAGRVSVRGALRPLGDRRYLELGAAAFEPAPGVTMTGEGRAEWRRGHALPERAELRAHLVDSDCAAVLTALPAPLRPSLAGLALDGRVAADLDLAFDRSDPDLTHLGVALDVARCAVGAEPAMADVRRLADRPAPDRAVSLPTLPRHVAGAFVAAEDARFHHHPGFDREQIERSLAIDLAAGALVRGGSTITQQLVKNAFLGQERTAARKLQEAVLTWRAEAHLTKRIILERYLGLIELGEDDLRGIGPAARHWFDLPPERLGVRQAAFLAALTPAPRTLARRLRERSGTDPDLDQRIDVVLRAMRLAGVIDLATYQRARVDTLRLATAALARR